MLSSRGIFLTQGSTHVTCISCAGFLQSLLPCPPSGSGHPHPHISPDTRVLQGLRAPWSLREEGVGLQSTQILEQGAVCWNESTCLCEGLTVPEPLVPTCQCALKPPREAVKMKTPGLHPQLYIQQGLKWGPGNLCL